MAIDRIIIVGGGTAGWMAAAVLSRLKSGRPLEITLVESEAIGTIGVGEATIPPFVEFNQMLEIDEREMLAEVRGTFKLGIQFVNWGRQGESYIHPFGAYGYTMGGIAFHQVWHRFRQEGDRRPLQAFNLETMAAYFGKFARTQDYQRDDLPPINYAYHLDAGRYAQFLRKYAEKRGVARQEGHVTDVALHPETGFVTSIRLASGEEIAGDLFIDCSGFRGLLIEQALATGYEDWTHWLPCDRALAVPCTRSENFTPYTKSTAHGAGWQWRIPLQHRTGNGHVYSSKFMDEAEAERILIANLDGEQLAEPNRIRFTAGKRRKVWNRNCVAVGLASGFLEPLESTSLYLIQSALIRLIRLFPDGRLDQANIDEFNRQTDFEYERIRDFIILHYKATERDDSEFWRYCRDMDVPATLERKIDLFRANGRIFREDEELFSEESWIQVMLGQGIIPKGYDPLVDVKSEPQIVQYLGNIENVIGKCVAVMPSHADFVEKYCKAEQRA